MKLFRAFAVASVLLAFAIAVLGSWVRINNAGLTCPDWPLCHGQLVPALHGGVVLEWSHRLIAFVETFVVLGAIATGLRVRATIAGVTPALVALGILFALQVSLGGITVLLYNSPLSVMLHWGVGMALLADLTVLAVLACVAPARTSARSARVLSALTAPPALAGAFAAAGALCFLTMCAGAYVSSSYAGLACSTIPGCGSTAFGQGSAQHVQMLHRCLAAAFALVAIVAAILARRASPTVRSFAFAACGLVVAQIAFGVGNVVWRLPVGLRELHAANAGLTFVAFVVAAVVAALEPMTTAVQPHGASRTPGAGRRVATNA